MILKCKNPKCNNEWDYKGKSKFYATCSICKSSIRIPVEEKEEEKEKKENGKDKKTE